MSRRSWQLAGILAVGLVAGWGFSSLTGEARGDGLGSDVLARVGDADITRTQVEALRPDAFLALARQRFDLTEETLEQAIRVRLVEVEAEARGVPSGELVQQEVYDAVADPTPEEIEVVYRRSGATAPLEQLEGQIRAALRRQAQNERYEEFLDELRARHAVDNRFEPLRAHVAHEGFPAKGPEDAPVTIVEFSDFQCPYCRQLVGVMGQVLDAYGDQIRFVYRHFPLKNIHPGAQYGAEASMCAEEQGKFWEMHDAMFANPNGLNPANLKEVARSLGMDGAKFDECLDSARYGDHVAADLAAGQELGISGTPALFVNGRYLAGVPEPERIAAVVLDELRRAGREIEPRRIEPIRIDIATEGHPARGPADAPVTIVEFSDFQCPFCARILPSIEQVLDKYGDQVRFVYRQFPIEALHPEAPKASEASLCANAQGRFWEMHDALFDNASSLGVERLKAIARTVGVDGARFDACLDSGEYADEVAADIADGRRAGVSGTPALFINGRSLPGLQSAEAISAVIEDELSRRNP